MTSFSEALALADVRRASDADLPADETGEFYGGTVSAAFMSDKDPMREVHAEHAAMAFHGGVYGMSAHDKGVEDGVRVCYTCRTEDW